MTEGLLDAYIAMIPMVGGDATPLGQRPFMFSMSFIGFGLPLDWPILRICIQRWRGT